jgi:hypothetical protein
VRLVKKEPPPEKTEFVKSIRIQIVNPYKGGTRVDLLRMRIILKPCSMVT